MPDYSLPKYDSPRQWINMSRERGVEWNDIFTARKSNDEELQRFLLNQEELNFWPTLSVEDWKNIVQLQKTTEKR